MTQPNPNDAIDVSRPGKKTLLLIIAAVVLFFVIKYWAQLSSFFHVG